MSLADKYMREACDMCENHAKNFSCEDKHTCPVYKLYCLADKKEKVIIKSGSWDIPPTPRPEQFRAIAEDIAKLYEKKDALYGDSFGSTYQKLGIILAVTRISDKYNRLCNLATGPTPLNDCGESIEDTLKDMAAYCIMTLMQFKPKTRLIDEIMRTQTKKI